MPWKVQNKLCRFVTAGSVFEIARFGGGCFMTSLCSMC